MSIIIQKSYQVKVHSFSPFYIMQSLPIPPALPEQVLLILKQHDKQSGLKCPVDR